jgi:hypothetical protein
MNKATEKNKYGLHKSISAEDYALLNSSNQSMFKPGIVKRVMKINENTQKPKRKSYGNNENINTAEYINTPISYRLK